MSVSTSSVFSALAFVHSDKVLVLKDLHLLHCLLLMLNIFQIYLLKPVTLFPSHFSVIDTCQTSREWVTEAKWSVIYRNLMAGSLLGLMDSALVWVFFFF